MSETTTNTADTITRALAEHPDGITTRALAKATGLAQTTVQNALTAMETDGTATRTPGDRSNGSRRTADTWHPASVDGTPVADDATATATATADEAPVADNTAVATTETPVADNTTAATTETPVADNATADEAPVASVPRQPDLKVLIMAGVLGDHPDGVKAAAAIAESGLAPATGDTILAAMEVAGAARRLPVGEDGIELWVRADGDLATVDPAKAPTHVTCPTCGHTRPVRRPSATGRRTGGTGQATSEINGDGSAKLRKGDLERMVEAFIRDLGPGHELSPVTVGRELGGRSSGACGNAMSKLTGPGVLVMTNPAPVKYALADNPPPPSAEVLALMTSHRVPEADDTTGTDEARAA
jgi:hypothetical protein